MRLPLQLYGPFVNILFPPFNNPFLAFRIHHSLFANLSSCFWFEFWWSSQIWFLSFFAKQFCQVDSVHDQVLLPIGSYCASRTKHRLTINLNNVMIYYLPLPSNSARNAASTKQAPTQTDQQPIFPIPPHSFFSLPQPGTLFINDHHRKAIRRTVPDWTTVVAHSTAPHYDQPCVYLPMLWKRRPDSSPRFHSLMKFVPIVIIKLAMKNVQLPRGVVAGRVAPSGSCRSSSSARRRSWLCAGVTR